MKKKRKYHIEIKLGADTFDDLLSALGEINRQINKDAKEYLSYKNTPYSSVCGCASFGWIVKLEHNPEMIHEKYFEEKRNENKLG